MTQAEYGKIIHALDLARERLAENGATLSEADQRIRELVNLAVRSDEPVHIGPYRPSPKPVRQHAGRL